MPFHVGTGSLGGTAFFQVGLCNPLRPMVRGKVKVVLDLLIYAIKKELNDATGIDISNLAAKRELIAFKAEDINKLVNVPSSLNNLKTKVDDLDIDNLKTVPMDLKKNKWCNE